MSNTGLGCGNLLSRTGLLWQPHSWLLGVLIVLVPVVSGAQPSTADVRKGADNLLVDLHERGLFSGAVVLGRGDEELYAMGFGFANVQARTPFTPDTPSDGGSIAKTLTAAAVLMLEAEGRLKLDDLVQRHLPEYPHAATRVRHLLTHSAALPEAEYDFFNDLIPADRVRTTAGFLEILRRKNVPPAFEAGSQFRYSSLGFDVAALLVERISGQTWEQFLRGRIFDRLGMRATFVRPARHADWEDVRTLSYRRANGALVVHDVFDNEGFYGGSNLYFSARDLHRWSSSFYTRPVLSERVLARGAEAAALWDDKQGKGRRSGLTLMSWYYPQSGRRYHYPGSLQGFWSSVYRDEDEKHSVVYVSNNSIPQWLRPLLSRALIEIVKTGRTAPIAAPPYVELSPDDVDALAGAFIVRGVGKAAIDVRGKRAFIRIDEGVEYPGYFVEDGQLYIPGLDVWIGVRAPAEKPFKEIAWLSIFDVTDGVRAQ